MLLVDVNYSVPLGAPGTLLGPEGSGSRARPSAGGDPSRDPADRPYLENCTVDASIFVATSYLVRMVDA